MTFIHGDTVFGRGSFLVKRSDEDLTAWATSIASGVGFKHVIKVSDQTASNVTDAVILLQSLDLDKYRWTVLWLNDNADMLFFFENEHEALLAALTL